MVVMPRSKNVPMTATQANVLLFEVGVVAAAALVTLGGALQGLLKVKKTAEEVRDVAQETASKVL